MECLEVFRAEGISILKKIKIDQFSTEADFTVFTVFAKKLIQILEKASSNGMLPPYIENSTVIIQKLSKLG